MTALSPATRKSEHRLYLAIGVYVFVLSFVGFARNFYLRPLGLEPLEDAGPIYPVVVLHAAACTLWMGLAVWQPWLILKGRQADHRKLGR